MKTSNCGVCVRGTNGQLEEDFYGRLTEVIEVDYFGEPSKKLVLFRCEWFDPTPNVGTKVNNLYGIVEVRQSRRYHVYDPFILAQQAYQVYYTAYPEGHQDWLGVIRIKARSAVIDNVVTQMEPQDAPYQDVQEIDELHVMLHIDPQDFFINLADIGGSDDEIDKDLLEQDELVEDSDDEENFSEDENEADSNDTD